MPKSRSLDQLARWGRPHRMALLGAAALMTVESAVTLSIPWLGGQFAGELWARFGLQEQAAGDGGTLGSLIALLILAVGMQALLQFASGYCMQSTGLSIEASLKTTVYHHLQALPIGYFHARRLGDSLALLTRDVHQVSSFITNTLVSIAPMLLTVLGAAVIMLRIEPWLAALCLVLIPIFIVLLRLFGRRLRPLSTALTKEHALSYALFEENLSMLPAIKTFTREHEESRRVNQQIERLKRLSLRLALVRGGLGPLVQFLAVSGLLVLLWLASSRLGSEGLQASSMVSFLLYAHLLARPVPQLANVYGQVQITRAALGRVQEVLDQPTEPIDPPALLDQSAARGRLNGDIRLEDISFAYPGREPVLRGLNLHIRAGETVAIVGTNGAGKSTLASLLLRMMQPHSGRLVLDGHDLSSLDLGFLRQQIGIVPQLPLLFHASVLDNICFGLPHATLEQVHEAARQACAHEFIEKLPDGYQTFIGDRGVRLSGGQQQRVSLARALIKEPSILILDEATSMFDPEAEADFLRTVKVALAGRTVVMITHRHASLALADRVLRIRDGQIVDELSPSAASVAHLKH